MTLSTATETVKDTLKAFDYLKNKKQKCMK